jgi:hypothetical protein
MLNHIQYYIVIIRKCDLILLFLPVYDSRVDLGDQAGVSGSGFDDLVIDFDWLQGLQLPDELAGSQLGGAPPTCT